MNSSVLVVVVVVAVVAVIVVVVVVVVAFVGEFEFDVKQPKKQAGGNKKVFHRRTILLPPSAAAPLGPSQKCFFVVLACHLPVLYRFDKHFKLLSTFL